MSTSPKRRPKRPVWDERSPIRFSRITKPQGERLTISLSKEVADKLVLTDTTFVNIQIEGTVIQIRASDNSQDYIFRYISWNGRKDRGAGFVTFLIKDKKVTEWFRKLPPEFTKDLTDYKVSDRVLQFDVG